MAIDRLQKQTNINIQEKQILFGKLLLICMVNINHMNMVSHFAYDRYQKI